MTRAFFISGFLLAYSYVVYPVMLLLLGRLFRRPWKHQESEPSISIIVSAFNEERVIREKVMNALGLDYPVDKLEVLVASDGSTDRTNEIVSGIRDPRISFHAFPVRSGKTACLNRVVPQARGSILLFTDANSILPQNMLRRVARNFADPEVGLVTGWTRYQSPSGGAGTTSSYAAYERFLKILESSSGSCVGADGAVFAMRKELYRTMRDDDINDFVIPLDVIRQNKRVVLDPDVFCLEEAAEGSVNEFQRQVRITTRTLWAIRRNRDMLNPFTYGLFALFMISHKVMRFLTPFFFVGMYVITLPLLKRGLLFRLAFVGDNLFLLGALAGSLSRAKCPVVRLCRMLFVTTTAQGLAWIRMIAGIGDTMWMPRR